MTKVIDSQSQVGGWPTLASLPPPADADSDGMPDAWETPHKLKAGTGADHNDDPDADGYTNLEEWLNGTDPRARDL